MQSHYFPLYETIISEGAGEWKEKGIGMQLGEREREGGTLMERSFRGLITRAEGHSGPRGGQTVRFYHAVLVPEGHQWATNRHCPLALPFSHCSKLPPWTSYTTGRIYKGKTREAPRNI